MSFSNPFVRVLYFIAHNKINGKQKHHNGYATGTKSFPSGTYIELTLGASGSTYTAPANGFLKLIKASTGAGQYVNLANIPIVSSCFSSANGQGLAACVPLSKGSVASINYTAGGSVGVFRFSYAQGEI